MPKRLYAPLILFLGATTLLAQSPAATPSSEACGKFVQQFYDWYLARTNALISGNSKESALEAGLREKPSSFSPVLVKALKEDLDASTKSAGEVVGLDFDPFLNAQDTPERYVVGEVRKKGDHFLVEVFGFWNGKKNSKPDVVPELVFEKGNWVFTNFHYEKSNIPENENLISVLKQLKEEREKPAK